MKVRKIYLLLIASLVWFVAGVNVFVIGLSCYINNLNIINIILSIVVFLVFEFLIFYRLVKKHTKRILQYEEEKQLFIKFFDIKSFIIMAFMMTGGIILRTFNLVSERFIAVFYTGLGFALLLAGILFGIAFFKNRVIR